jgi:hypothetical protein
MACTVMIYKCFGFIIDNFSAFKALELTNWVISNLKLQRLFYVFEIFINIFILRS